MLRPNMRRYVNGKLLQSVQANMTPMNYTVLMNCGWKFEQGGAFSFSEVDSSNPGINPSIDIDDFFLVEQSKRLSQFKNITLNSQIHKLKGYKNSRMPQLSLLAGLLCSY